MSLRKEWQEAFDTAFPEGARVELSEREWFHVPRVMVMSATAETLELALWQMDANGELPLVLHVDPNDDLAGPVEEFIVREPGFDKLTIRAGLPPDLAPERSEWELEEPEDD